MRSKNSKPLTKAEREHLAKIKAMPCACCGEPAPSHAHHPIQGMHFLCLPMCYECHQGDHGLHGDRARLILRKKSELSMLATVIETLMSQRTREAPIQATEPATDALYLGEAWLREAKHDWLRVTLHPEHLTQGNPFQGPGKPSHYMLAVIPIPE